MQDQILSIIGKIISLLRILQSDHIRLCSVGNMKRGDEITMADATAGHVIKDRHK